MQPGHNFTQTSNSLWTAALTIQDTSGKTRGKVKKTETIHHPKFEQASQSIEDDYWKETLHNCAKKKFPRGFGFADGILKHRTNNISILLPDNPYHLAQTAIYFFQENGKLYSKNDIEIRKRRDEDAILLQLINASNSWTCISRSKNKRSTYVRDYVERKYSSFSQKIKDEIYTQINIGFETKYITKDHVLFEGGQVIFIDGVDSDGEKVFFTRPLIVKRLAPVEWSEQSKPKVYCHTANWHKWCDDYQKYIVSSAKSNHVLLQTSSYMSDREDSEGNIIDI
jgi:hypothetical protein